MWIYIKKNGYLDAETTHKKISLDLSLAQVIVEAANNYARNVETMGSQPKEFRI